MNSKCADRLINYWAWPSLNANPRACSLLKLSCGEECTQKIVQPVDEHLVSMISEKSRSVLSIGCGWGASECRLAEKGLHVVAVPLDPVICGHAAARGVEMVVGDFRTAKSKLASRKFDCILYFNVLHLIRNPIEVLSLFRDNLSFNSMVVIKTPNMLSVSGINSSIRYAYRFKELINYDVAGVHVTFVKKVRNWCMAPD